MFICFELMFRACLSVRKSYEEDCWASSYVGAYGYVLKSRLTVRSISQLRIGLQWSILPFKADRVENDPSLVFLPIEKNIIFLWYFAFKLHLLNVSCHILAI